MSPPPRSSRRRWQWRSMFRMPWKRLSTLTCASSRTSSSTTKYCPERRNQQVTQEVTQGVPQEVPPAPWRRGGGGTFGRFGLLLLEACVQLAGVIVETFERLMEDPVLGLHGRVHVLHGGVELVIRDASSHVPASHKHGVNP